MGSWGYTGQIRPWFFHPGKRQGSRTFPLLPNEPSYGLFGLGVVGMVGRYTVLSQGTTGSS